MSTLAVQPLFSAPAMAASAERLSPDDLRELMQSVTDVTQRLQATHVALHEQVARLQRELAEANAALRRSQSLAALGEMAAGIAHEVRNPLGSIQLYVHMLEDDVRDRPEQAALCRKIDHAVVTLDAIVRDVLAFARETKIDLSPTNSSDLFDRALQACASLIKTGNVNVLLEEEPRQPLSADVGLMTQALGNVMRNAIEAMIEAAPSAAAPRHLRLWAARRRTRCPDGRSAQRLALCVQDNGPGISAEVRDRIFNPFFTTRTTGTGLGLAIVHRIVDAHGGHIAIEDVKPHGTRVELCLPMAKPANTKRKAFVIAPTSCRSPLKTLHS
jgi:signal transduction histidine kinase